MIDLIEFFGGKYKVVERDISEERAKELEKEVKEYNDNPDNLHIRGIMSDFMEIKQKTEKKMIEKTDYEILENLVSERRRDCNSSCSNTISQFSKRLREIEDKLENGEHLTK